MIAHVLIHQLGGAQELLRHGFSVTDACMAVGCTSLGSFSSRFTGIVGVTPSSYRNLDHAHIEVIPPCVAREYTRPRREHSPATGPAPNQRP
ncbi:MAG: helix-turn-helix domain-containing protein [Acidimicrobiales bacterium]|nr:helix-turn-helix domain-containing protein [Acidimicrobiales bacterium]